MTRWWMVAFAMASGVAARAEDLEIEPDQVLITADAKAGPSQFSAVSHALQWRLLALGGDRAQVRLSVPVASFESGHPAVDAVFKSAIGAPEVVLDGVVAAGRFKGTMAMAGVSRPVDFPIELARAGMKLIVHTAFDVDLREFGVSVPRFAGRVSVEFFARLHSLPNAVMAGAWHG